jgi:hypothetical protein
MDLQFPGLLASPPLNISIVFPVFHILGILLLTMMNLNIAINNSASDSFSSLMKGMLFHPSLVLINFLFLKLTLSFALYSLGRFREYGCIHCQRIF